MYHDFRNDGLSVEASLRGICVAVLMSPDFCYLYTTRPVQDAGHEGSEIVSLNDHDLASRPSFFVWSSLPDNELLAATSDGKLQDDDHLLLAQTQRMLRDDRIQAFAREFFGQWLRYRDY